MVKVKITPSKMENEMNDIKKRILVIDDSEIDCMILEEILKQAGYEVITASDGEEGMKKFHENQTDLVITDMVMPGKMGQDVIYELKEEFPELKIIAISAGSDFGVDLELTIAKDVGASYTLAKPYEPEIVLKVVKKLLA